VARQVAHGGVERLYSIGPYPRITLEAARAERDFVRAQLREGSRAVQVRGLRRAERVGASAETVRGGSGGVVRKEQALVEQRPL